MNNPIGRTAGLLILPRLQVQNANAISSPLTWGFPSPTAFLGFVHSLERRLSTRHGQVFNGVGIVCHDFRPQTFRPNRRNHLIFTQSRNPVYLKRDAAKFIAEGTPAAIVEEGRAHLEVSLVISLSNGFDEELEGQDFAEETYKTALGMRLAGGSLIPSRRAKPPRPAWLAWPDAMEDQRKVFSRLRRRLLPGFALVLRSDLLGERVVELEKESGGPVSALDALLDLTRLNHHPVRTTTIDEEDTASSHNRSGPNASGRAADSGVDWQVEKRPGWLVPLPIGYAGISPLYAPGEVAAARDMSTPFRFVESLYSLGQWIGPHRLANLGQLLWYSTADPENGLYRCTNRYSEPILKTEIDTSPGI